MVLKRNNGEVVLARVRRALSRREKRRGLLGRNGLEQGEGLLLKGCRFVHTFLMKFPVGLIYLDKRKRVAKIVHRLAPWRVSACPAAESVVECRADLPALDRLRVGEYLLMEEQDE